MSDLVKIELPFFGFYNSIHDDNVTRAVEDGFNYDYETGEDKEVPEEVWSADVDYNSIFLEYAEKYVEAFGYKFDLDLKFDEVTSPREYNFRTDRIFALAPREQIDKIRKEVEKHPDWQAHIKERCSDGPGFWSFYSNDHKDEQWTRETLDECQYEIILRFWLENISDEVANDWHETEVFMMEDSEMSNWDSVIAAHEVIEKHLKEKETK